LSKNLFLTFQ